MATLARELCYALRTLGRAPLLFTAAVLTLAAGTGLATGVFAVAYGVLLRPLPYPEPARLVAVDLIRGTGPRGSNIRLAEYEEWQRRLRTFDRVAAHATAEFTLRDAGEPRSVRVALVTDGFFETLGLAPKEGALASITRGALTAAISSRLAGELGDSGWRDRRVTIASRPFSIVAVMPNAFAFPAANVDVWIRADAVPGVSVFTQDDQRRYQLIGRLVPGVTIAQAQDDARRVSKEIDDVVSRPPARELAVFPVSARERLEARATVVPFVAGSVLVLLIACANVSGLLVARVTARRREFAVRRTLGGSLAEVLRTALMESLVVTACGWALGVWLAHLLVRGFEAAAGAAMPNLQTVRMDTPVLLVSCGLAVIVALISGGAPALRAARTDPNQVLKQTSERLGGRTMRGTLVVTQVALTLVLLVAAGLLMRTVVRIVNSDRSFDSKQAMAMRLMLTETAQFNTRDRTPVIDRLLAEIRRMPGVAVAGVGSDLPPSGSQLAMTISLVDRDRNVVLPLSYSAVTPGYLDALGMRPVAGRLFEEADRLAAQPVVVITELAARTLFQDLDAVGREIPAALPRADGVRARPRVIGVVRDVEYGGLDRAVGASIFTPWEALAPGNAHLVVRTTTRPTDLAPALRRVMQELDPTLPVFAPQTLDEVVAASIADRRLRLKLAATFAALAVALAAIAIWGAVAQSVLDRRRELAVRLALGSTQRGAIGLMVRSGLALTAVGVAVGMAGAVAAARAIRHMLYGIEPLDPIAFAAGIAITVLASAAACYLPARRAAAISPSELLREA